VKRVRHHQFLYLRGGTYHFRRAIPPEARAAFGGKTEFKVSLKTGDLAQARHLADLRLKEFDRIASRALGRADPTACLAPQREELSAVEIEAAVRRWLEERTVDDPVLDYSAAERGFDGQERVNDLGRFSDMLGQSLKPGGGGPALVTEWTVEEIAKRNGWVIEAGIGPAFRPQGSP
jgi:hypothetical protein